MPLPHFGFPAQPRNALMSAMIAQLRAQVYERFSVQWMEAVQAPGVPLPQARGFAFGDPPFDARVSSFSFNLDRYKRFQRVQSLPQLADGLAQSVQVGGQLDSQTFRCRQRLAREPLEQRLGVERVDMRRSAVGEDVNDALGLAEYVVNTMQPLLTPESLPAVVFASMALVSFMTGSNWGVFVIVLPIVTALSNNLGADMTLVIGATLSASTFGSHACFYSDATVLTAQASGCTPMQHAITQIPYALIAALITIAGFLMLAYW